MNSAFAQWKSRLVVPFRDAVMRRPLRSIVAATVTAIVALVAIGALGHRYEWGIQWGNVSTWAGAAASAAVAVTLAYVTHRRTDQEATTRAQLSTAAIFLVVTPGGSPPFPGSEQRAIKSEPRYWDIKFVNGSDQSIHDIRIGHIVTADLSDFRSTGAIEARTRQVYPGATTTTLRSEDHLIMRFTPADYRLVDTHRPYPAIEFTDANGLRFRSSYRAVRDLGADSYRLGTTWTCIGKARPDAEPIIDPWARASRRH